MSVFDKEKNWSGDILNLNVNGLNEPVDRGKFVPVKNKKKSVNVLKLIRFSYSKLL